MENNRKNKLIQLAFLLPLLGLLIFAYISANRDLVWVGLACMVLYFFVMLSMIIAKVAEEKGRSYQAFFLLSLLFSPIIMGIVAAAVSPLPGSKRYVPAIVQTTGTTSSPEVDQIEKLGDLLAKGLITQAEFDDKKAKLLDRL